MMNTTSHIFREPFRAPALECQHCDFLARSLTSATEHVQDMERTGDSDHNEWELVEEVEAPMQVEAVAEESRIFTFGMGSQFKGRYVRIAGDTELSRSRMIDLFGSNWSMQYRTLEEATRNGKYPLTDKTEELVPPQWQVKENNQP